jgi:hypothetical protein
MGINGLTSTIVLAKEIVVDMVGLVVMRGRHGGVNTQTHAHGRTHAHAHRHGCMHMHTHMDTRMHMHMYTHFVCVMRIVSHGANFVKSFGSWIGLFVLAAVEVEGECRGTPASILGASSLVKEYKNKKQASRATLKR